MSAQVIAALGGLLVLATGVHMRSRPSGYLGRGSPPATNPLTVRQFGLFFMILGALPCALLLFSKFASE